MNPLIPPYVECALFLLHTKHADVARNKDLAHVIDTLDLSPANLAVSLVFLGKYTSNSVNVLDLSDSDLLHYYTVIASLILANKFINDQSYTLKTWQSILARCLRFDAPLSMLNQLEMNFLAALDYSLATQHSAALWLRLAAVNPLCAQRMRSAVEGDVPEAPDAPQAWTPTAMVCVLPPAHMTNSSYHSTPVMAGPVTPLSLPVCVAPMVGYGQLYPSPGMVLTPLAVRGMPGPAWEWEPQAKRRKIGAGWACEAPQIGL